MSGESLRFTDTYFCPRCGDEVERNKLACDSCLERRPPTPRVKTKTIPDTDGLFDAVPGVAV
jgi:predicted amidophosphoribosyltransferase